MKVKNNIIFAIAILLMISSCVHTITPEEPAEQLTLQMRLTLPSAISTRADGYSQSGGTASENYINFKDGDFKLLIFDKNDNIAQEIESDAIGCTITPNDRTDYAVYTMTANLDLSDESVKADMEKFRVMVLANWLSVGNTYFTTSYPIFEGYRASGNDKNIFKDEDSFIFVFPGGDEEARWTPSYSGPGKVRAIPMFGLSEEIDLEYALLMGKESDMPVTSIPMLRSLAKIEIVDKTTSGITDVRMDKIITPGRFIPDIEANPDWNDESKQVSVPSLPSRVDVVGTPGGLGTAFHSQAKSKEGYATWALYVPEVEFHDGNSSARLVDGGNRTVIGVKVNGKYETFPFDNIKPRTMQGLGTLRYVLRNHIYRFTVEEGGSRLDVTLEVLPWDKQEVPVWNFENPKLDGPLRWKTVYTAEDDVDDDMIGKENGYNDKSRELKLIMKPGITDYAEGTFKLTAPVGARWYAELISLNQDHHDSFQFVGADKNPFKDAAGNPLNYATGIIDGKNPQTIRIMNLSEKVFEENNEARLVITIEYPDKTRKEVYVVDPSTGGNNYTIVQEITEFV